jgi:hypothetical protein
LRSCSGAQLKVCRLDDENQVVTDWREAEVVPEAEKVLVQAAALLGAASAVLSGFPAASPPIAQSAERPRLGVGRAQLPTVRFLHSFR